MPKEKKQVHKSAEEVKSEMAQTAEQKVNADCVAEIDAILKKYNRTLEPFMQRTDQGDFARVRLMAIEPKDAKEAAE